MADECTNETEIGGQPTTNRCFGVACKRDDQCQDGYCVTNKQTPLLEPTYVCANYTYRPACNYSKQFNYFDETEKFDPLWSKNICPGMVCDWTPDCGVGYVCTNPPYETLAVCNNDPGFGQCNISTSIVVGKDYSDVTIPLTMGPSTNRCVNVNCEKSNEC
jgi:hypothetical protein